MSMLSDDQLSEHRDAFGLFDRKGDGKIDVSQLGDVLRALGQNPTNAEVKKLAGDIKSADHRLSFEDFLPIFNSVRSKKEAGSQEAFIEGLRVFDKDGNGTINSVELRHVLTSLGEKLNEEEVDQLLTGMEDSNGQVQYEEFIKTIMSG
ncbi:myosin-2 essential light chain-like [Sycon ciliatum]|uniref:myosin-2 essential light chain-like n=1 Tax=Sycon ciliatum TaxID=27933 RepID=UPI0020A98A50|eukprot:scpid94029/ scgid33260/ Myosin-2 essential light chain; Myosin II essential light chain; Non-muscle myosin essential light chain